MHKLQMYENLRDMLERNVSEIEKAGELNTQSLDQLYKLMTAIKYTDNRIDREQGGGMSMAYRNRSYGGGSYNAYDSYGAYDGMSGARRGRDGDGDGRYNESRDSFRGGSYRGGSYNAYGNGYSRDAAKQKMVDKLSMLMDEPMSEQDRNAIMDCIEKIQ